MVEAQETNASKLSLLQRHREARELLVKIQADEADHERPRRPQSASCSETFGKRLAQSSRPKSAVPTTSEPSAAAAANLHFRPAPNPLPPHLGGGSAPSAPRKRPLSAFPSRVTVSPVGRRPASACGVRERFVHNSQASKKKEPSAQGQDEAPSDSGTRGLPSQGPDLLAFAAARFGPAPPLPPLPPELERGSSVKGAQGPEEELDDFTPEERRLEQESEEALNQLEALDAAVEALRMKLEVSKEEVECSQAELLQLRSAAISWTKAAEESRQELKDRELRLQELLGVLPAEDPDVPENEESDKHSALAAERLRVLQLQTDRLQEQVEVQQALLLQRLEERKALESQVEALTSERDEQKALQQKARAALRMAESQLKVKEEALSAFARRRQDLERQSVRMRGEVRGLKARLAALAAQAKEKHQREASSSQKAERQRQTSLKLQHEVVELWEALRNYREKANISKKDHAKEELLQSFRSRDSTRYLVALQLAKDAEVEAEDIPCIYSLHRLSDTFHIPDVDVNVWSVTAQLCFVLDYTSSMKTQVAQAKASVTRMIEAVRNVYIPLLPNASVDLEMTAIAYNDWDEGTARLGRPVVAAFGGKEIKQAHDTSFSLEDFNLGGRFTRDAAEMEAWLDQDLGHGGFIPEELTGALLAASHLDWTGQHKFAVVITDAPCHGKEYSRCVHDVFCDRRSGLTCSGRPEVPLGNLTEKGVKVFIFHTGEDHAVSMCEKLQEAEPGLIHEKVDPSETADKLVSVLKGKLQLQPLTYLLKPLTLGESGEDFSKPLDLAVAHDVELEDTTGKEKHRVGVDGLVFVGQRATNPKVTLRRPLESKLDLFERRSQQVELNRLYDPDKRYFFELAPLSNP